MARKFKKEEWKTRGVNYAKMYMEKIIEKAVEPDDEDKVEILCARGFPAALYDDEEYLKALEEVMSKEYDNDL